MSFVIFISINIMLLWSNGSKANFRLVDDIFTPNFAPEGQYANRTKKNTKSSVLQRSTMCNKIAVRDFKSCAPFPRF